MPWVLYPQGKDPWYPYPSQLALGTRASLDVVARRKNFNPCWELNLGHPAHSLDSTLTETPQLQNLNIKIKIIFDRM